MATEGLSEGRGDQAAIARWQRRLHVQKHAWMHLRSRDRSDTMALRRRRIVISRCGSGRTGVGRTGHPGWSDHDLRAASPAAERGPVRDAGPTQSPVSRTRARRKWSPLPRVHHPWHRHPGGTLAMPDSRGRRGRTGRDLTGSRSLRRPSRGTSIATSPTASEITVFDRDPLRTFVDSRPASS